MKIFFTLFILIQFVCQPIAGQVHKIKHKGVPPYLSKTTKPYYYDHFKWFKTKPVFLITAGGSKKTSGFHREKKQPPVIKKTQAVPPYATASPVPFFFESVKWEISKNGIWEPTVKRAAEKRKEYDKEQFRTLKQIYKQGKEKEALGKALSMLNNMQQHPDRNKEIELLDFIASFCSRYELWNEAEIYFKTALGEQLQEPELFGSAPFALKIAEALGKQKKYDDARKYISFALSEYTFTLDLNGKAACSFLLAENYFETGHFLEAEKIILNRVLPLYSYTENQQGKLSCFEKLAQIYARLNRNSEAKWFLIQQNMLAKTLGDREAYFRSLVGLGQVKTTIMDYDLALKDLQEAAGILKTIQSDQLSLQLEEAYAWFFQKQGFRKLNKLSMKKCRQLKSSLAKTQAAQKKNAYNILNTGREQKEILIAAGKMNLLLP